MDISYLTITCVGTHLPIGYLPYGCILSLDYHVLYTNCDLLIYGLKDLMYATYLGLAN